MDPPPLVTASSQGRTRETAASKHLNCFLLGRFGSWIHPVKSYHLSCFGFGKVNSIDVQVKCAKPHDVLAILLSQPACILKGMHLVIWCSKSFCQSLSQIYTAPSAPELFPVQARLHPPQSNAPEGVCVKVAPHLALGHGCPLMLSKQVKFT